MTDRSRVAAIRFGLGPRLGEALPADPLPWLEAQIARPAPPPAGPTVQEALRLRAEQLAMRTVATAEAPPGMATAAPPNRGPLTEMMRAENLAWAQRRLTAEQPFRERLVDFWMNHFTVSRRSGNAAPLVGAMERDAIRPHLTGRFVDMLLAATRHPAMLLYLDNHVSVGPGSRFGQRARRGLNENLAREVLELHTLSPAGGYTQGDVTEFAKVLTGLSVDLNTEPFDFVWRAERHEPGDKTVLGRRVEEGEEGVVAALRMLGTHPATWRHLAVKLARHFVADDPPPEAVRALAEVLRRTEGDLGATYRVLVGLPGAWTPLAKFRTPMDFAIAAVRATGAVERPELVLSGMIALGQPLWTAPQPNGWSDRAGDWAGPEALMRRVDWAYTLSGRVARPDIAAVTEAALGPFARAETVATMRGAGSVRDALTVLFSSPEFMHR
ncbi:DUF1800 domain-containing protein [Falsiroseomonas sp. CW058]|uniref:DUF1800 domain-containing protein n=1 Tax=Falsiroseomonas sp. CW058 TaxID=3388664 RepID=UPI003D31618B